MWMSALPKFTQDLLIARSSDIFQHLCGLLPFDLAHFLEIVSVGFWVSSLLSISPSSNFHWPLFCQFLHTGAPQSITCSSCPLFSSRWSDPSRTFVVHSHLSLPLPQTPTNLLYDFLTLLFMDVSHKWSHSIYGLLGPAAFTELNNFEVHSHCSMFHGLFLFFVLLNRIPSYG